MFVPADQVTVERNRRDFVNVDPGAYITPVGKDFKLVFNRPDYDTPVTAKLVDPASGLVVLETFSPDLLDGWSRAEDFTDYEVVGPSGRSSSPGRSRSARTRLASPAVG